MSADWPIISLREAGVTLIDCDHKTPKAQINGFPYIGIPQLKDGRISLNGARLISEEDFNLWRRKAKPIIYDVILSRRCNPGETAYVPRGLEIALGQNLVLLRADGNKLYPPFLRWVVQGPIWWEQISKFINVGAVFDSLRCANIPNFEIKLPPIELQKKITDILASIDNKIVLNREMNKTLETMAQAIFKSWFVDFEPSKEGKFVESELGMIPIGWEVSNIGAETTSVGGATPSTTNPEFWEDGEFYWATPKDLSGLQEKVLIGTERKITNAGVNKISSGQLPVGTVLLSSRAPIGYLAITTMPVSINQGFIAMVCNKRLPHTYVLQWATYKLDDIKQRGSGTTFAEISKSTFRPIQVLVPDKESLQKYDEVVRSYYNQIAINIRETQTLSTLRNTLLPKLLSGEIGV